jgi:5'-3' exoribonuclease 1
MTNLIKVLMGFLVGNDFIPHLPGMHINSGALSVLYKAYCEVLPTLDGKKNRVPLSRVSDEQNTHTFLLLAGYLNEAGVLNLERFEVYMKKLASFDIKHFREQYDDMKYLKAKTSKNGYRAGVSISVM